VPRNNYVLPQEDSTFTATRSSSELSRTSGVWGRESPESRGLQRPVLPASLARPQLLEMSRTRPSILVERHNQVSHRQQQPQNAVAASIYGHFFLVTRATHAAACYEYTTTLQYDEEVQYTYQHVCSGKSTDLRTVDALRDRCSRTVSGGLSLFTHDSLAVAES
jgi:hypothetical protein